LHLSFLVGNAILSSRHVASAFIAAAFPLFIEDGTRRPVEIKNLPDMPPQRGLGMILNMMTMETFGIRGGKIHEVEAFPFIAFAYGQGDGWTPAVGR